MDYWEAADGGVFIVGFSSRGAQSSATLFRLGSAFRGSITRRTSNSAMTLGPVVPWQSQAIARGQSQRLIQIWFEMPRERLPESFRTVA